MRLFLIGFIAFAILFLNLRLSFGQGLVGQVPIIIPLADTNQSKLPFRLAKEKMLSDEDLAEKREGVYATGVPDISQDPLSGFGYGVEGEIFFNDKRTDPLFKYTPYRTAVTIALFNTTRNQREVKVGLDIPFLFDTPWRLRGEAAYEKNPNLVFFGQSQLSLNKLSTAALAASDNTVPVESFNNYNSYINTLPAGSENFNGYTKEEYIVNVSAERSFMEGKMRVLGGLEAAQVNITQLDGRSYIAEQAANNMLGVRGFGSNLITIVQAGLVYDTRDLEPDPSHGTFAEITDEVSLKALGSKFDFNKIFAQVKTYQRLFPRVFGKMILAARVGAGHTSGNAPFFEYQDQWSSEGSMEGLGGTNTLRGYKQSRFLAQFMNFGNVELRTRFLQTKIFKQGFAFSAVPFFDIGTVSDNTAGVFYANNYRYNSGLGLRIAWNVSTILRFDYAVSKEDKQFFFTFGHAF